MSRHTRCRRTLYPGNPRRNSLHTTPLSRSCHLHRGSHPACCERRTRRQHRRLPPCRHRPERGRACWHRKHISVCGCTCLCNTGDLSGSVPRACGTPGRSCVPHWRPLHHPRSTRLRRVFQKPHSDPAAGIDACAMQILSDSCGAGFASSRPCCRQPRDLFARGPAAHVRRACPSTHPQRCGGTVRSSTRARGHRSNQHPYASPDSKTALYPHSASPAWHHPRRARVMCSVRSELWELPRTRYGSWRRKGG